MTIENDKKLVRRAHTDRTPIGKALLQSLTFEMADTKLAAANWFWSDEKQDFAHVAEPSADNS